ncbi:hypothetical protein ACT8ZS_11540 [Paenibacillus sp. M.A.Huq-84]
MDVVLSEGVRADVQGCFYSRGYLDFRAAAEGKEIDGNPPVNLAWISFESNITGKSTANIADMDDLSPNPWN